MSAEDVGAIYEFLRSLPPADGCDRRSHLQEDQTSKTSLSNRPAFGDVCPAPRSLCADLAMGAFGVGMRTDLVHSRWL